MRAMVWQVDEKGLEFPHQGENPYRRHPGEACPGSVWAGGRGSVVISLKSIS
jgi:hypothetical protein